MEEGEVPDSRAVQKGFLEEAVWALELTEDVALKTQERRHSRRKNRGLLTPALTRSLPTLKVSQESLPPPNHCRAGGLCLYLQADPVLSCSLLPGMGSSLKGATQQSWWAVNGISQKVRWAWLRILIGPFTNMRPGTCCHSQLPLLHRLKSSLPRVAFVGMK